MAAPKGNQFWKNRSKHGRDRIFASPEIMYEAACSYFNWVDENPLLELKPIVVSNGHGQGSEIVDHEVKHKRPYTLNALCIYLGVTASYFRTFKSTCKETDVDFLTVISQIEETIYNQKFEGASTGFFNANIIARDLGLVDKQHQEVKQDVPLFPDVNYSDKKEEL